MDSSQIYRMMIYFAHSTIIIYGKTIIDKKEMTIKEFREQNKEVVQRIFDEGLSIFNYELSYDQVSNQNTTLRLFLKEKSIKQNPFKLWKNRKLSPKKTLKT